MHLLQTLGGPGLPKSAEMWPGPSGGWGGYPYVLVRLDVIDRNQLAELLEGAWRIRTPKQVVAEYESRAAN